MKVTVNPEVPEQFVGFYEHARRRPGDVFAIEDMPRRGLNGAEARMIEQSPEAKITYDSIKDKQGHIPQSFSMKWMRPVAERTPDRVSTSQQALDRASGIIKQERAGTREIEKAAASADVI